jgi:hypothetical protein
MKHTAVQSAVACLLLAAATLVLGVASPAGAQPEARRFVVFESFMTPG